MKRIRRVLSVLPAVFLLSACGNGAPSKQEVEALFTVKHDDNTIKVTDLRCHSIENGAFSCFLAYQRYFTEKGAALELKLKSGGTYGLRSKRDQAAFQAKYPEIKAGGIHGGIIEKTDAEFHKVNGKWETDAFPSFYQQVLQSGQDDAERVKSITDIF
ncbi:hypothetical protein FAI40_03280 [Acetobacteraceae bacterium]|nr:hypothetical protein FAI40_03280 [Acetobacteraceae bacterium]